MRCYRATLIPALLLAAIGNLMAQSPEPQTEIDGKLMAQSQPEVLCERTEFGDNLFFPGRAFTSNSVLASDKEK